MIASKMKVIAATIDILPTLAELCDGKLPERKIDGHNIWPLMAGKSDAKSPHDVYVLMHGPGTVRVGKWKFYPRAKRKTGRGAPKGRKPSPEPVQLYDINSDIGETKNLAAEYPDVVKKLKAVYQDHVNEIKANRRLTAKLQRPEGKPSAARP